MFHLDDPYTITNINAGGNVYYLFSVQMVNADCITRCRLLLGDCVVFQVEENVCQVVALFWIAHTQRTLFPDA
jgi:hypothetical protein